MRMLSAASGTQRPVLSSVLPAVEFVTVRAGEREGSAVFFPAEKLVCLPVQTARRLGLELFEHVDVPPAPTGLQRVDCLDSPSDWVSIVSRLRPPFCAQCLFGLAPQAATRQSAAAAAYRAARPRKQFWRASLRHSSAGRRPAILQKRQTQTHSSLWPQTIRALLCCKSHASSSTYTMNSSENKHPHRIHAWLDVCRLPGQCVAAEPSNLINTTATCKTLETSSIERFGHLHLCMLIKILKLSTAEIWRSQVNKTWQLAPQESRLHYPRV